MKGYTFSKRTRAGRDIDIAGCESVEMAVRRIAHRSNELHARMCVTLSPGRRHMRSLVAYARSEGRAVHRIGGAPVYSTGRRILGGAGRQMGFGSRPGDPGWQYCQSIHVSRPPPRLAK